MGNSISTSIWRLLGDNLLILLILTLVAGVLLYPLKRHTEGSGGIRLGPWVTVVGIKFPIPSSISYDYKHSVETTCIAVILLALVRDRCCPAK